MQNNVEIKGLTVQKKAEYIMQNQDQLDIVGQLAAGIAHEIRNPLTVIKGFTELCLYEKQTNQLDIVMQAIERVEEIVSDLLLSAKPPICTFEEVDIRKILSDSIMQSSSGSLLGNIEFIQDIHLSNPMIMGDANKLKRVFMNIFKNAIEMMLNGGKILIEAHEMNENQMTILVIDEGIGIPTDQLHQLDEPFYGTKDNGTSLGIMICHQIINNHGGTFIVQSVENKGTTITIQLPTTPKCLFG